MTRALALALSLNRVAFGLNFLFSPASAGKTWIRPRKARSPDTVVFIRATGARDLALGVGALAALASEEPGQRRLWMLAHFVADATDLAATLAMRERLPSRATSTAVPIAGASTAIAAWSAFRLGRRAS
jgi:hypothetical protein